MERFSGTKLWALICVPQLLLGVPLHADPPVYWDLYYRPDLVRQALKIPGE